MSTGFAANTEVAVERSKMELERILRRAGATQYGTAHDDAGGQALVYFTLKNRQIRMSVPLPKRGDFVKDPRRSWVTLPMATQEKRWEQACRTRWRGIVLICKAKLELIGLGLSTVDREFLADITIRMPNGQNVSVGQLFNPALLDEAYRSGTMPPLLGMGSEP